METNARACTLDGRALHISMDWELTGCFTALQGRTGGSEYALAEYPWTSENSPITGLNV